MSFGWWGVLPPLAVAVPVSGPKFCGGLLAAGPEVSAEPRRVLPAKPTQEGRELEQDLDGSLPDGAFGE